MCEIQTVASVPRGHPHQILGRCSLVNVLFTSVVTFITATRRTYLYRSIRRSLITCYYIYLAGRKLISFLCSSLLHPVVKKHILLSWFYLLALFEYNRIQNNDNPRYLPKSARTNKGFVHFVKRIKTKVLLLIGCISTLICETL